MGLTPCVAPASSQLGEAADGSGEADTPRGAPSSTASASPTRLCRGGSRRSKVKAVGMNLLLRASRRLTSQSRTATTTPPSSRARASSTRRRAAGRASAPAARPHPPFHAPRLSGITHRAILPPPSASLCRARRSPARAARAPRTATPCATSTWSSCGPPSRSVRPPRRAGARSRPRPPLLFIPPRPLPAPPDAPALPSLAPRRRGRRTPAPSGRASRPPARGRPSPWLLCTAPTGTTARGRCWCTTRCGRAAGRTCSTT